MLSSRRVAFATSLLLCVGLAGCAAAPTQIANANAPVAAQIVNQTGKAIARVEFQTCDAPADQWSALSVPTIGSGQYVQFQLPSSCANFRALDATGKVVGTQTGVRRDFPFRWTIS
jgi:hypothetical protein